MLVCLGFSGLAAWFGPTAARSAEADNGAPLRVIRVGVLTDNDPFSFRNADGEVEGFVVDLLAGIERVMSLRLERVVGPTQEINAAFLDGRLDMLQSYARSIERMNHADFSVPYLSMSGSIFVRRGLSDVETLDDLAGRRVLVHGESLGERLLRAMNLEDSIVTVGSVEEALQRIDRGEGDATLAARLTGLAAIHRLGLRNVVPAGAPISGYDVHYCFGVRAGDRELLSQLNEGLAVLQRTGEFDHIYERWLGRYDPTQYSTLDVVRAVAIGLAVALVVVVWALVRQRTLRHRIARQAEALRESEARYRGLFDSSLDGLLVLERAAESSDELQLVKVNAAARRIFGLEQTRVEGRPWRELLPRDGDLATQVVAAMAGEGIAVFEHRRAEFEPPSWLRVSVVRVEDGWLLAVADVSEEKAARERLRRHEEQVQRSQKLEALGTLASGVAHDFNNVLSSILGNAELARMDVPPDHRVHEALDEILQGADRARILVRQILAFARQTESSREVLSITPLVKETLRFIAAAAPRSIAIQHDVPKSSPEIEGDPTQLHQVLMNVCTNAVHAMREQGGRLGISEAAVELDAAVCAEHPGLAPGEHLRLTISDTGTGMEPAVLEHVFEPFFTTKPLGEGTGLGLAVAHGIVKSHGGAIYIDSQPGVGTVIRIYFPAVKRTREAPASAAGRADLPTGRGEEILFLDDEPAIAQMAGVVLKRLGYAASTFCDPQEALEEFEKNSARFALVFTDLTMPRLNGLEVARRVRAIRPDCPVALASGFLGENDQMNANGITLVVEKPLTVARIATAVASCLNRGGQAAGVSGAG